MADGETLTREQALLRLHDHLGEYVRFMIRVKTPDADDMPAGDHPIIELDGVLAHPVEGGAELADASLPPATREIFGYLYKVGEQTVSLPPLPGTIREWGNGIDFQIDERLVLRIAWRDPDYREGE
jgi:hypothetical protein